MNRLTMTAAAIAITAGTTAWAQDQTDTAEQNMEQAGEQMEQAAENTGDAIEQGVVLIEDGKIQAVGKASEIEIPEGARTLDAAVVTPGLIDAHGHVMGLGLARLNADLVGAASRAESEQEARDNAP